MFSRWPLLPTFGSFTVKEGDWAGWPQAPLVFAFYSTSTASIRSKGCPSLASGLGNKTEHSIITTMIIVMMIVITVVIIIINNIY